MMLESPGNFGDTGSKELPQRCHCILDLVLPSTTVPINN